MMMTRGGRGRRGRGRTDVPGQYCSGGGNPVSLLSLFGALGHGVTSI